VGNPTVPRTDVEPKRASFWQRHQSILLGIVGVALLLALWEIISLSHIVNPLFLPSPAAVARALAGYVTSDTFGIDMRVSGEELLIGYVAAIAVALPLGVAMGWYRTILNLADPLVNFFNATPRIALAPLTIVWFGVGLESKFVLVFLSAIFPILINTTAGVRSVDQDFIRAAKSFGASDMQIFRTVALPAAVPYVLSGMRIGIGHGLIGVVVGELVAAQHGIGLVIANAGQTFQTPLTFAAIIIVAFCGLVLTSILSYIEGKFDRWRIR